MRLITFSLFSLLPFIGFSQTNILQGSPDIKNYTSAEINGGPQIFSWAQDKRGMVYVGDGSGIIEFNGRDWKRIETPNNTIVREMAVDTLGRIFVGASDNFGLLQPNNKGEMKYISLSRSVSNKGIKFLDIWGVFSTSHGVFFCSNKYVFRYYHNKISIIPVDFMVQDAYLLNDQLYLPTQKGLCLLTKTTLLLISTKVSFHLIPWRGDELLSTNGYGELCTFNLKTSEIKEFKTSAKAFFKNNPIHELQQIDSHKYVANTETNKIVIFSDNGDIIQIIDKNNGFSAGLSNEIDVDKDKNLWICTSKGISKIDINFPALGFGEKNNINTNVLKSCLFNGKRYIATIDGIYYLPHFDLNKPEESQNFIKIKPINDESWDFIEMNEQLYAICSNGVWVINDNTAKQIFEIFAPQKAHCFSTSPLFPNTVFVGMRGKLVALKLNVNKDINKLKVVEEMDFPEITEKIRRITSDINGNLWLNTQFNGIYFLRFIDGKIKNYRVTLLGKKNGLLNADGTKTYLVNNKITVSTESGLLQPKFPTGKNKADSLIRFEQCMMFGDSIKDSYSIVGHVRDNKYLIAGNGLHYASIGGTKQTFDTCGFNRLSFAIESFSVGIDSLICFCSPSGLIYYNIKNRRKFNNSFSAVISKVVVGNDSLLFNGSFYKWVNSTKIASLIQNPELIQKLDFRFNSLTFYYSGLFFENPEGTEFQHQLVGYDKKWSDWSTENKTNYTYLFEGKYTFKVRAKNVYGVLSNVADYQLVILPPWYRTWWAIFIYILLFGVIVYTAMVLYGRRLKKQKESLEIIIKERTSEIIEQAKELKTSNDRLVEMDNFKQGLTNMIVHDLKTPINVIINSSDSDPANQLMRIKQMGKQMLNLVLNILDVNKYEETKIVLNTETICLLDLAIHAIDNIQFLTDEKNITVLNRIQSNFSINADYEMVERVFVNLLTNAIKYTPNNGCIIIDATKNSLNMEVPFVKVSIADNGIGIAPDKIDFVFQKFGQVVAKNSGSVRSTGLGLTYCKMVVEAHGGEISVVSEPEKGSTFWFTLPDGNIDKCVEENEPIMTDPYDLKTHGLSTCNQLIIKDILFELQKTEIYKITELSVIVKKIDETINDDIKNWKMTLITAIDSGNDYLYQKLISTN